MTKDVFVVSMRYKNFGDYFPLVAFSTKEEAENHVFETQLMDERDNLKGREYKINFIRLYY